MPRPGIGGEEAITVAQVQTPDQRPQRLERGHGEAEHGGADFKWATRQEDRTKLWEARHRAYYSALALRPGAKGWPTDVCVTISKLAECIIETKKDIEESGLLAPKIGRAHV